MQQIYFLKWTARLLFVEYNKLTLFLPAITVAAFITVTIIVIIVVSIWRTSLLFYIFACEITIEVIPWSLISLFFFYPASLSFRRRA